MYMAAMEGAAKDMRISTNGKMRSYVAEALETLPVRCALPYGCLCSAHLQCPRRPDCYSTGQSSCTLRARR